MIGAEAFDSKLEADRWCELNLLQGTGEVLYVLRQVPFRVAPGVTYRCDFLIVWKDRPPSVEDCKGVLTPTSRVKIRAVEERYRLKVNLVTRSMVRKFTTS